MEEEKPPGRQEQARGRPALPPGQRRVALRPVVAPETATALRNYATPGEPMGATLDRLIKAAQEHGIL